MKGKSKEVKVELWQGNEHLNEIYQLIGVKYAFLTSKEEGNKQCHPWIKCRDFLHDALRAHVAKKKEGIFGFRYESGVNPPLDLEKMRLLVKRDANKDEKNISENTKEIMDCALAILNCVEKYTNVKPLTKLYETNQKDIYLFEGAKDWMESTFMISLYTLLIRLGARKITFKDRKGLIEKLKDLSKSNQVHGDNDIKYLKTVWPFIYRIMRARGDLKYMQDGKALMADKTIGTFHAYTGIVSLCKEAKGEKTGVDALVPLAELIKLKKKGGVPERSKGAGC